MPEALRVEQQAQHEARQAAPAVRARAQPQALQGWRRDPLAPALRPEQQALSAGMAQLEQQAPRAVSSLQGPMERQAHCAQAARLARQVPRKQALEQSLRRVAPLTTSVQVLGWVQAQASQQARARRVPPKAPRALPLALRKET